MDIILKLNEAFESFMSYFNGRKESIAFLGVYFLVLIYIWFQKDKEKIQMLIPMSVFLAATVFNFLVMEYLVIPLGLDTEWYRMYWLVPVIPVTAYGAVELIRMQENKIRKWVIAALCIMCIYLCGQPVWKLGYNLQDNEYKVRDSLIEIVEIIRQDRQGDTARVLFPSEYYIYEVRQYDASILMATGRDMAMSAVRKAQNGEEIIFSENPGERVQQELAAANMCNKRVDPEVLKADLAATGTEYVVCDSKTDSEAWFEEAGCAEIGGGGQYKVLKVVF